MSEKIEPYAPPGETWEEIQAKGPWQVQGPDSADWALGKLAEYRAQVAEVERQAEAAHAVIEARRLALVKRIGGEAAGFEAALTDYAVNHRADIVSGKRKSKDYLHGRIQFRAKGAKLVIEDAAALAVWLEAQPAEAGLWRVKIEPDKKALDAYFEKTDVLPPGCKYEPATESITVETIDVPRLEEP